MRGVRHLFSSCEKDSKKYVRAVNFVDEKQIKRGKRISSVGMCTCSKAYLYAFLSTWRVVNFGGCLQVPAKLKQVFKMMKPTDEFKFPDGTVITGKEAATPPRQGRKVGKRHIFDYTAVYLCHLEPMGKDDKKYYRREKIRAYIDSC